MRSKFEKTIELRIEQKFYFFSVQYAFLKKNTQRHMLVESDKQCIQVGNREPTAR